MIVRCGVFQGWYIVTYALGIYHLNLFIAFLSPKVDPSLLDEGKLIQLHQNIVLWHGHVLWLAVSSIWLFTNLPYIIHVWIHLFMFCLGCCLVIIGHSVFFFGTSISPHTYFSCRWGPIPSYQAEWGVPPFHQEVAWIQILVSPAQLVGASIAFMQFSVCVGWAQSLACKRGEHKPKPLDWINLLVFVRDPMSHPHLKLISTSLQRYLPLKWHQMFSTYVFLHFPICIYFTLRTPKLLPSFSV